MDNQFPEVFSNHALIKTKEPMSLCADALYAWGNVLSGIQRPESFGETLVAIRDRLGMTQSATGEGFSAFARQQKWIKDSDP